MEKQGDFQAAEMSEKGYPAQGQGPSNPSPPPSYAPTNYPPPNNPLPMQNHPATMYPQGQPPLMGSVQAGPQVQYIIHNPQPLLNPPDDYFIHAILVTVFCFWPTGIIAIIKALDSRRAAQTGDAQNAQLSSKAARKMYLISLFIGIACWVLLAVILVIELMVLFNFSGLT